MMNLKRGDAISVIDECYEIPPKASPESMRVAVMSPDKIEDTKERMKLQKQKDKFAANAKGKHRREAIGEVLAVAGDIVSFRNVKDEKIEQAMVRDCSKIKLCTGCRKHESGTAHKCK